MRVDIERVRELLAELAKINEKDIHDIEVHENGQRIDIPEEVLADWKFTGLSNVNFIELEPWKEDEIRRFMADARNKDEGGPGPAERTPGCSDRL